MYLRSRINTSSNSVCNLILNDQGGNVGIGTTIPKAKLEVNGNAIIGDNSWAGLTLNGIGSNDWTFNAHNDSNSLHIRTQNDGQTAASRYLMTIKRDTGNVGIGTNTQGFKLGVNGKIAATEVRVALYDNWADFVFYDDYKLPTLTEVENHIKVKGHLKDIPSAAEVAENGIMLGDMNAKLLKKAPISLVILELFLF